MKKIGKKGMAARIHGNSLMSYMRMIHDEPASLDVLVRRYRREAGLTQAVLAKRAGISVRTLISIEQPQQRPPRSSTLAIIANALSLSATQRAALFAARRAAASPTMPCQTGIPRLPITLLGRDAELEALTALLDNPQRRLVTVTGTAGVGKTSIALAIAAARPSVWRWMRSALAGAVEQHRCSTQHAS